MWVKPGWRREKETRGGGEILRAVALRMTGAWLGPAAAFVAGVEEGGLFGLGGDELPEVSRLTLREQSVQMWGRWRCARTCWRVRSVRREIGSQCLDVGHDSRFCASQGQATWQDALLRVDRRSSGCIWQPISPHDVKEVQAVQDRYALIGAAQDRIVIRIGRNDVRHLLRRDDHELAVRDQVGQIAIGGSSGYSGKGVLSSQLIRPCVRQSRSAQSRLLASISYEQPIYANRSLELVKPECSMPNAVHLLLAEPYP